MISIQPVYFEDELSAAWIQEYQGLRDKINDPKRPNLTPAQRKQLKRIFGLSALRDYKNGRRLDLHLVDNRLADRLRSAARAKLKKTTGAVLDNQHVHHWMPLQYAKLFRSRNKGSFFGLQDPNRTENLWVIAPTDHILLHNAFQHQLRKRLRGAAKPKAADVLAVARLLESKKWGAGKLVRKDSHNHTITIPHKGAFSKAFLQEMELPLTF